MELPELPDLPVREALGRIVETLAQRETAVLVAPPGTGKTTLVPLALAAGTTGRVLVAEPRRLAARAAAARMAALLGEPIGRTVGYSVRGDRRVGADTRIEVVTSGLLVRRLQNDPELAGVDVVVLDECHERHLDADLLLALLLDARAGLLPDLRVLATSATVAADRLAALLGGAGPAPVLEVRARTYPVDIAYLPALPRERTEAQVARATRAALDGTSGDVLVFLPGAAEIRRTTQLLSDLHDVDVLALHGRLSAAGQDAALRAGPRRRVVLSTAVAESSLTVPGVRAVVDSGLARVPRIDRGRGLSGLATVRVSAAVAEQRAGRAGRQGPGRAWRCWPENEHSTLPAYPEPEIRTADLTRLALELACWGTPDGRGLAWWDDPPPGGLAAGRELLRTLGAVDESGTVTGRGRRLARVGLHPRLARALLDGTAEVGARTAAEVVSLLDDETLTAAIDLAAGLRDVRRERPDRWRREVERLTRLATEIEMPAERGLPSRSTGPAVPNSRVRPAGAVPDDSEGAQRSGQRRSRGAGRDVTIGSTGGSRSSETDQRNLADDGSHQGATGLGGTDAPALVVALAYPERLARRRGAGSSSYLMASGTAVTLPPGSGLGDAEWLAVAVATRDPGRAEGRIRSAAVADEQLAREAAPNLRTVEDEVDWIDGEVVARRVERIGAITVSERPLRDPDPRMLTAAVRAGLRSAGLSLLHWNSESIGLRNRLGFLYRTLGAPWPAVDDDALLADVDTWLGPELAAARRRADLERIDAGQALRRLLPWPEAARLDELAPDRIRVPSGSMPRLDYAADPPVLAVKVQEVFGWTDTPRLADGRVPILLHLLSPAQRPVAVTADLASFWHTGWPQVRSDLRGRYPKHSWPEDPGTVTAHRGTARNAGRA
ncbi:ATP-dependent RNA helicase [Nocardia vaccinii]|uniref:ATP-dependent RNA helicase n=1 Tax=Nocardia vaccinii TaxID=1822 RepID=UPI00082C97BC|nr:ATP-dependent helicase C-terminal domain-containing protein [Nocardia vaccinii]